MRDSKERKSFAWVGRPSTGRKKVVAGKRSYANLRTYGNKPLPIFRDPLPPEVAPLVRPYAAYENMASEERRLRPFKRCMVLEEQKESHLLLALTSKKQIPVQDFETLSESEYNKLYPPIYKSMPNDLRLDQTILNSRRKELTNETLTLEARERQPIVLLEKVTFTKSPSRDSPLMYHATTNDLRPFTCNSEVSCRRSLRSDSSESQNVVIEGSAMVNTKSPEKRVVRSDIDISLRRRRYV